MVIKMRDMMKRKNGQKGFTLVELIVVMAILAILAAIAVPKYNSVLTDAQDKADKATARTIASAVTMAVAANSGATTAPTKGQINSFLNDIEVESSTTVPTAEGSTWTVVFATDTPESEFTVYKGNTQFYGKTPTTP